MQNIFDSAKEQNESAYCLFFEIEVILREFLIKKLQETHGSKWMKRGLPPDVLKTITEGLEYERSVPWNKNVLHQPLYYVGFPDLKKIIINGTNWTAIFSDIFIYKANTEVSLSDLEAIRNKIAHNRFVTRGDLQILQAVHQKLLGAMSPADLTAARDAAIKHIPIASLLGRMQTQIICLGNKLRAAEPIEPHELDVFESINQWWFNEMYLAHPTESIEQFVAMCREYSAIPRGLGQALKRLDWATKNEADLVFAEAQNSFEKIILIGDRHATTTSEPS